METLDLPGIVSAASGLQIQRIFALLIALAVLVYFVRFINAMSSGLQHRYPSERILILQITTIITFAIYIFGTITLVYVILRPSRELLLAIMGSAAVAVGFSLKDLVASLFAGIVLLFERPFQVGDRVQFGDIYGEVKAITLRSVRINTLDDNLVTIPNSKFITEYVASANAGALEMMVVVKFHFSSEVDIDEVREILYETVVTSRFVFLNKPVLIVVSEVEFAKRLALCFTVKAYVIDVKYEKEFETDIVTRVTNTVNKAKLPRPKFDSVQETV